MIVERGDAFHHNANKKVAQLIKVITSMEDEKKDYSDQIQYAMSGYEDRLAEICKEYRRSCAEINQSLSKFRKIFIDLSCQDYGRLYREMKSDFMMFYSEQSEKISKIQSDAHQLSASLQQISSFASQIPALMDSAVDDVMKVSSVQQQTDPKLQKIIDSTTSIESESKAKLQQLSKQHSSERHAIEQEMAQILTVKIREIFPDLIHCKGSLKALSSSVKSFSMEIASIRDANCQSFKERMSKRNQFISDAKSQLQLLKTQIKAAKDRLASQKSAYEEDNQRMKVLLYRSSETRKNDIYAIENQIDMKKKQQSAFSDKKRKEMMDNNAALDSIQQSTRKTLKSEMKARTDSESAFQASLDQNEKNLNDALQLLMKFEAEMIENLGEISSKFSKRVSSLEVDQNERFHEEQISYCQRLHGRESSMQDSYKLQLDFIEEKKNGVQLKIENLKAELQEVCENAKKEESEKSSIIPSSVEYETKKAKREKEMKESIENMKKGNKVNEENVIRHFKSDEKAKINEQVPKNEGKKNENQTAPEKPKEIATLQRKLSDLTNVIESSQAIYVKRTDELLSSLNSLDKTKRQLQRSMKTESDDISQDFETKIQIGQVNLSKAIDNISALYNADENARGRNIVEAIRKARSTRNQKEDAKRKQQRDVETLRKTYKEKAEEANAKIEELQFKGAELKTKVAEKEALQKEIAKSKEEQNKLKENGTAAEIKKNEDEINNRKAELEKKKAEIELQKTKEVNEINQKMNEIKSQTAKLKENVDLTFQELTKNTEKEHKVSIDRMNQRLASATKQRDEFLALCQSKENEKAKKYTVVLEEQKKKFELDLEEQKKKEAAEVFKKDKSLSDLVEKQNAVEIQLMNPSRRAEDEEEIKRRKEKAENLSNKANEMIKMEAEFMQNLPNREEKAAIQLAQSSKASRQSSSHHSKQTLIAKVGSSRLKGAKMPQILSPQLI